MSSAGNEMELSSYLSIYNLKEMADTFDLL